MSTPGGLSWQGGWDEPGVLSLVIIETGIPGSGLFLYNGVPGVGTLLASVTESSTDPFGNTTQPGGFVVYNGTAYLDMHINTTVGAPAIEMVTGVASEAEHAALYTLPANTGLANEGMETIFTGPGSSHDNTQTQIQLVSAAADGSSAASGSIFMNANGVFTLVAFWTTFGFRVVNPPDVQTYTPGHLILSASATTINNTTGITVTGLSTSVGIGSYYIRCILRCVAAASGTTQQMAPRLSGTATPSGTPWRIFTNANVETSGTTVNPSTISGFNVDPGVLTGAVPNNTVFDWTLEGIVTFSAAGTLLVQARQVTSAASETFTVQAGSFLIVEPV